MRRASEGGFVLHPIGVVRSPFVHQEGTPIQPVFAEGAEGRIELLPGLGPALAGLEGFERIWLLYILDRAGAFHPRIVPYRDEGEHGLFATRAPARPNPLGLSSLRLLGVEGNVLRVGDIDVLDGTPVLDVKPYVPAFDSFPGARAGWLDTSGTSRERADRRFE